METKLQNMLDSAVEADSQNVLSAHEVRKWLVSYLARHSKEVERFPETTAEPHFDLIMADFDKDRDALFVAAVFREAEVSLVAGRGNGELIRRFAESDFPDDSLDVIPNLSSHFRLFNQPLIVSIAELDRWLKV